MKVLEGGGHTSNYRGLVQYEKFMDLPVAATDIVSMGQDHWTSSVNKQQFG